jgi:hypothetical protein
MNIDYRVRNSIYCTPASRALSAAQLLNGPSHARLTHTTAYAISVLLSGRTVHGKQGLPFWYLGFAGRETTAIQSSHIIFGNPIQEDQDQKQMIIEDPNLSYLIQAAAAAAIIHSIDDLLERKKRVLE